MAHGALSYTNAAAATDDGRVYTWGGNCWQGGIAAGRNATGPTEVAWGGAVGGWLPLRLHADPGVNVVEFFGFGSGVAVALKAQSLDSPPHASRSIPGDVVPVQVALHSAAGAAVAPVSSAISPQKQAWPICTPKYV